MELPAEVFTAYLSARIPSDVESQCVYLEKVAAADLYLACACLQRDRRALELLAGEYVEPVLRQLQHGGFDEDEVATVQKALIEILLEERGKDGPKLAQYRGAGSLKGWLAIAARRVALNLRRGGRPPHHLELQETILGAQNNTELAWMKSRVGPHFSELTQVAFKKAFAALPEEERNLLWWFHIDGCTQQQIGTVLRINKSTVSRRLASALQAVREQTIRILRTELGCTEGEITSLLALIGSQLVGGRSTLFGSLVVKPLNGESQDTVAVADGSSSEPD